MSPPISISWQALREQIIKAARGKRLLILYSEKHNAYRPSIEALPELKACLHEGILEHVQLSSKLPRTVHMELFSVNYMDREFRKDLAEHVRESTRFGRNVNNAAGRMELYLYHHNHFKAYRINVRQCIYETHA